MKYLVIVFLFVLSSCSSKTAALPTKTAEMPTATAVPVSTQVPVQDDNFLLILNEGTFISNFDFVINELLARDPELGNVLLGCDIAVSFSPTAEDVSIVRPSLNGKSDCAVTLIRQVDYSTSDSIWGDYNPNQPNGRSLVAAVIPLGESEFPLMVIPENTFDAEYFIRVIGHEAFHMLRFLRDQNCPATAEKSCEINEEVLAFQRQFELLEAYLIKTGQMESYQEKGLTFLPGTSDINKDAVRHEFSLYFLNKDGLLYDYLFDMNYGEGFK